MAEKLYGWQGKTLRVDLTTGLIREEALSRELREGYIGGAGINARLLYEGMKDNIHADPLSADNVLIFGFGILTGTSFPCCSRVTVTAKSPVTGIFGDSNAGGFFPARVKQAGYDHIVITGKAAKPCALYIENGKAPEIVDAADLWGLDSYETGTKINERFGDCESARIGPAGENLVRYASIYSGTRRLSCNGKTGMGCVMGSKNLKAVIVKGSGEVAVADKAGFKELADKYRELWGGHITYSHREYGSLMLIAQNSSQTRINNQQVRITPEQLEKYDVTMLVEKHKKGQTACYRCPIACTIQWEAGDGPYEGEKCDKLEFGHYTNMGPLLGVFDFPALVHLSDKINRLGMDCVTFGWIMAMAMECWQRGILTKEDTGGIELNWGDARVISTMLDKIALREGFGNVLADSMPMILKNLKPEAADYGFHTKGSSFTYNCTQAVAMSLASSVATRGADHLKGHPFMAMLGIPEMIERALGPDQPEEMCDHASPVAKGRAVWWSENYKMLLDSLGVCFIPVVAADVFGDPLILFKELGEMYRAATGLDPAGLFEATERAYQLEKCFNALLGISRKDDYRSGTRRGEEDPIHHPGMLEEYYWYRGCSEDGLPSEKRLQEVGLAPEAGALAQNGCLGRRSCPKIEELAPPQF